MKPGDIVEFSIGPKNPVVIESVEDTAFFVWRDDNGSTGLSYASISAFEYFVVVGFRKLLAGSNRDVLVYSVHKTAKVVYTDDGGVLHKVRVPLDVLQHLDVEVEVEDV